MSTQDLRDTAAAVVADEIDLVDIERVEELREHRGVRRHRDILIRGNLGIAVCQEIHGDAPPHVGQSGELMSPDVPVQQHAMDEQRDRSLSRFDVADPSGWSHDGAPRRRGRTCRHRSTSPAGRLLGRRRG